MQQHLLLVDETFDLNFTQEYYLSIQFSLDGFSFCILDGLQNKYIYLFHKEFSGTPKFLHRKLKDIYSEFDILEANFKRTQILYSSPGKSLILPKQLFDEKNAELNYQANIDLTEDEVLHYLPIKPYEQILQFAIPHKVKNFFEEKHPGVMIQHDLVNLLTNYSNSNTQSPLLEIQLYKSIVTITLLDKEIRFCNSFRYRNDNDLLYYILNVVKTEQIEGNIKIQLNGRVNKRTPIYHHLRQYFKHVQIKGKSRDVYYSYLFDQLPDARFVNLLNNHS